MAVATAAFGDVGFAATAGLGLKRAVVGAWCTAESDRAAYAEPPQPPAPQPSTSRSVLSGRLSQSSFWGRKTGRFVASAATRRFQHAGLPSTTCEYILGPNTNPKRVQTPAPTEEGVAKENPVVQDAPHKPAVEQQEVLLVTGRHPLSGHSTISGAKNSALAILAGALLCPEPLRLYNVPPLGDVKRMGMIMSSLGCSVARCDGTDGDADCLHIDASNLNSSAPPPDLVSMLRASFFVIGSLIGRFGHAEVPLPGGCNIGTRPVELHLRGLQALGCHVELHNGTIYASTGPGGLKGANIFLDYPSVGATETLMMAACVAEGETVIENAAREPEVEDLANFYNALGANIQGAGTNRIVITGVKKLHGGEYSIIPDRIEAGTMLIAGAITKSEITIGPVVPDHLASVIAKVEETGCRVITESPNVLRLVPTQHLRAVDVKTLPYCGFPTDMQAQFMALTALCNGRSVVSETVFENRMQHAAELARMGADIKLEGNIAVVTGVDSLVEGTTTVQKLHHLDRGYDQFDAKLRKLGAVISRVTEDVVEIC
eukprot:tig00021612_g22894.t1